jgi:hypothetical protein
MKAKQVLPHEAQQIEQFVIEGLIKGYASDELLELLKREYGKVKNTSDEYFNLSIKRGYAAIKEVVLTDLDKIIPQHIELYEKIYQEFGDLYYVPGKLKALRQKEAIVGLHKEQNFVEVHNEINVEIEQEPEYDIHKLTIEEQGRLEQLMTKALSK